MNAIEAVFGSSSNSTAPPPTKELGQEDFLKLLVAQLKNQDPNDPADNGEFLGQIAQFSMVSGIDDLGVSFDGVADSLYTSQAVQASQLVGRQALVETNTAIHTAGETVDGLFDLTDDATNIKLQIHDDSGSLVKVFDFDNLGTGLQKFTWDGLDESGILASSGKYELSAEGLINGELEGIPLHIFSDVESVSVDRINARVLLHLANEKSVEISQVSEYR